MLVLVPYNTFFFNSTQTPLTNVLQFFRNSAFKMSKLRYYCLYCRVTEVLFLVTPLYSNKQNKKDYFYHSKVLQRVDN